MAVKVPEEIELQLRDDRKAGLTYAALQEKYDLTQRIVRRICEGVQSEQKMSRTEVIDKIYILASRPEGAKFEDYYDLLASLFGYKEGTKDLDMTMKELSYLKSRVKEKAKKENRKVAFIPSWLDRTQPSVSQQNILIAATNLFEDMQKHIDFYVQHHPETNTMYGRKAIERELLNLSVQGHYHQGVEARCDYISECVDYLINGGV